MRKWLLGALGTLFVVGIVGWISAPWVVRRYVQSTYPEVELEGDVDIDFWSRSVKFRGVEIDRAFNRFHATGELHTVTVDFNRNVHVVGGKLALRVLDQDPPPSSIKSQNSNTSVTFSELDVKTSFDTLLVELGGVSGTPSRVCFKTGDVVGSVDKIPTINAKLKGGCIDKRNRLLTLSRANVLLELPVSIPKFGPVLTFEVEDLYADVGQASAEVIRSDVALFRGVRISRRPFTLEAAEVDINHPWVSPQLAQFQRIIVQPDSSKIRLLLGEQASIVLDLETQSVRGSGSCSQWIPALPKPLPESMRGIAKHFSGELTFFAQIQPSLKIELTQTCKFDCSQPPLKALRDRKPFTYKVYDSSNKLVLRTSGPGSKDWVPLGPLPLYLPEAFRLSEDPGFHHHKGIHVQALRNSLEANLKSGTFKKGGSTITMQLAKNLWLRRHKTFSRKAQEALLTLALESCLSKSQIMELYMNVVEYGPNVYGIGPAAHHYFDVEPVDLDSVQAFYLALLLPRPRTAALPSASRLKQVEDHMTRLSNSGYLPSHFTLKRNDLNDDSTTWETSE